MSEHRRFTSSSVLRGHPDKLCDWISDALVDAHLTVDTRARIRAEAAAKKVRDEAEHDLMRLSALRSNVHAELARLAEVLVNELPAGESGNGAAGGTEQ